MKSIETGVKQEEYTIDEAISAIGFGTFQYKILIVTGLIWAADSIEIMILTFLLPILADEWNLNNGEDGTIGSVVFYGMLMGSLFWSNYSDRFGRRKAVIISNGGQIIFGMMSAIAWDVYSIIVLRFLTGFCLGSSSCAFILYAEYAPKENRGKLLILQQAFWAFGAFFNALLAWLVLELLNWRYYLVLSSLPLVVILYFTWTLPESVRYLVAAGKMKEAQSTIQKAARLNNSTDIIFRLSPQYVTPKRGDYRAMFKEKHFATTVTLLNLMCAMTFSYYAISFVSERFFDKLSGEDNNSDKYWKVAVTTSSEIPGIIICMLTVDKFGRKNSMVAYFIVSAICMFILIDEDMQNIEWLSVTLVFIGRMCLSACFLVLYAYFGEYYPTHIRATALGLGQALSRIAGSMATYVSQADDISYSFYLIGLASIIGFVCSLLLKQDTLGRNLTVHDKNGNKHSLLANI